jgi:septum formation inhibitor MinC
MLKYRRCVALLRGIFVLLEVSVLLRKETFVNGTLISKSDLTVCDSVGQNPHNVVDNKSCQKKLIIAQAVRSGQVRQRSIFLSQFLID